MRSKKKRSSIRSHCNHRYVLRDQRALIRHQYKQGRDLRWLASRHRCKERTITRALNNKSYDNLEEDKEYLSLLDIDDNCSHVGEDSGLTTAVDDERGESSMTAQKGRCRAPSPASIASGSGICTARVTAQLQPSRAKTSTSNDRVHNFLQDLGLGADTHIKKFRKLGIRTAADLRTLKDVSVENGDMVRMELLEVGFNRLHYMQLVTALQRL